MTANSSSSLLRVFVSNILRRLHETRQGIADRGAAPITTAAQLKRSGWVPKKESFA